MTFPSPQCPSTGYGSPASGAEFVYGHHDLYEHRYWPPPSHWHLRHREDCYNAAYRARRTQQTYSPRQAFDRHDEDGEWPRHSCRLTSTPTPQCPRPFGGQHRRPTSSTNHRPNPLKPPRSMQDDTRFPQASASKTEIPPQSSSTC